MAEREFDPEEANYFKAVLEAELEYIEGEVIPLMKEGALNYAPAFGLTDEGGAKASEYSLAFSNIWSDIQNLKATLKGMVDVVEGALEGHQITEDANVQELGVFSLDGIHSANEPDPTPDYGSLDGGNEPV